MGLSFSQVLFALLVLALIAERLLELRAAKRNTARLLAEGGREFGAGHYPVIVVMHVLFFTSLITEFAIRHSPLWDYWGLAFAVLLLAQSLRMWARITLSGRWTARIIVVPYEKLIARGPYSLIPHPIYIAVALELLTLPLIFGLYCTAGLFTVLNACVLLLVRIPAEEKALKWSQSEATN